MLINLLGNAVKYTEQGIYHSADRFAVTADTGDNCCTLQFEVEDTGSGIAAGDHERIFKPFEQAARVAARKAPGSAWRLLGASSNSWADVSNWRAPSARDPVFGLRLPVKRATE